VPLLACAGFQRAAAVPPLQNEGEVALYLSPQAGSNVWFEVLSAAAVRSDGELVPLEVDGNEASARQVRHQRRLASGRLATGTFHGFEVRVRHPVAAFASETVQIGEPKEPFHIDISFTISARTATVVVARAVFTPLTRGAPLTALFSASVAPRTVSQLSGFVTQAETDELTIFDKHAREVTSLLPTGRAPWGIALDPVQNRGYVALSDEDEIAIVDLANQAGLSRIRLNAGDSPRDLVLMPDRRTVVSANAGSSTVSFIDAAQMIETGRVQTAEQPVWLLLDRRGQRVYAFNQRGSSISVIDPGTRSVVATIPTDNPPVRGQFDSRGTRLYVASPVSAYLTVLSLPDYSQVKRVYVGTGTTALKVDSTTDFLYVAGPGGRISVFDPFSLIPIDFIDLPADTSWFAIDAAENTLFALMPERRTVAVVQLTTKAVLAEFDVGPEPRELALIGERN
jgi:YVTN family beta-propeller protein